MKDLGLDFGQLIAYFVPGCVIVNALEISCPVLLRPLSDSIFKTFLLLVAAVVAGMVTSICRAGLIDPTFAIDLHKLRFVTRRTEYGPTKREEIDYLSISSEGMLNAFREAVLQEKRPYQFCGNTLLALIVWIAARVSRDSEFSTGIGWIGWTILGLSCWGLYVGARHSHHRYMKAVKSFNSAAHSDRPKAS